MRAHLHKHTYPRHLSVWRCFVCHVQFWQGNVCFFQKISMFVLNYCMICLHGNRNFVSRVFCCFETAFSAEILTFSWSMGLALSCTGRLRWARIRRQWLFGIFSVAGFVLFNAIVIFVCCDIRNPKYLASMYKVYAWRGIEDFSWSYSWTFIDVTV